MNILGASGITFRTADDDEDGELHIVDPSSAGLSLVEDGQGAKLDVVDDDGDSHMDSGEDSDATAAAAEPAASTSTLASTSSSGAGSTQTTSAKGPTPASETSEAKD